MDLKMELNFCVKQRKSSKCGTFLIISKKTRYFELFPFRNKSNFQMLEKGFKTKNFDIFFEVSNSILKFPQKKCSHVVKFFTVYILAMHRIVLIKIHSYFSK